ncbi:PREDICTED: titin-like [Ceratosolen solmsi marchali]|uniref:Titin-like n=1 Tax=Ceratosolen solmsi marchali TaxID=326594 RepID=A0AAJ7DXX0_9HYME|nr:PREDICTED: titin-like [Ceratosolen solmsi marchali]
MDMCKIPDGLHELCADISMEVLRIQPDDIYSFVANYLDILLITRENTKFAVKIVRDIVLNSEQIVEVLSSSGLDIKKIAAAAPRLQEAFRTYLYVVDIAKKKCGCDNDELDKSEISICRILKETGAPSDQARLVAKNIQAIFRRHYEQVLIAEGRSEIQWERADLKTRHILLKIGITEAIANEAALTIQQSNTKYNVSKGETDVSAWLDMMFEEVGLTFSKAQSAANIIQVSHTSIKQQLIKKFVNTYTRFYNIFHITYSYFTRSTAYRKYRNKTKMKTDNNHLDSSKGMKESELGKSQAENKKDVELSEVVPEIKEVKKEKMENKKDDGNNEGEEAKVEELADLKIKNEKDDTQTEIVEQINMPVEPKIEDEKNYRTNAARDENVEITRIMDEPVKPKSENEVKNEKIETTEKVDEPIEPKTENNEIDKMTETGAMVNEPVKLKTENEGNDEQTEAATVVDKPDMKVKTKMENEANDEKAEISPKVEVKMENVTNDKEIETTTIVNESVEPKTGNVE